MSTPTLTPSPTSASASATPEVTSQPATPSATAAATATLQSTPTAAATTSATATTTVTSAELVVLPTPTPASDSPLPVATNPPVTASIGSLTGTIIANRSEESARFFVEGVTRELAGGQSQGLDLPRASTVLSLYNCPASVPESTAGCFWDPYLVERDGFYEIYDAPATSSQVTLLLREAGSPPTDQVWVQNRTETLETVVYRGEVQEIAPAAVLEFAVPTGVPAILYVRSCMALNGQSVCEWAPKTLDAGIYYAMVRVDTSGSTPGSLMTTIDLRPVVTGGAVEAAQAAEAPVATGPEITCRLIVPALNIRSGPGLQYAIIGKVRSEGLQPAEVIVVGRSADSQWVTVDPAVVEGGWINNNSSFVNCVGNVDALPIVEAPAAPTPEPVTPSPIVQEPGVIVEPAPDGAATPIPAEPPVETNPDAAAATPAPAGTEAGIPAGQSLLVIHNGFEHEMRFTIDQIYRPQEGPSEYDLQPGASISIVVFPGKVAFTASSGWNGLSQNAEFFINSDSSMTLWLRFERDEGGSWVFKYD